MHEMGLRADTRVQYTLTLILGYTHHGGQCSGHVSVLQAGGQ